MLRAQDDQLRAMVKLHGGRNWKKIAEDLVNKTDVQCLHRWQKVLNPELVKGPWRKEARNPSLPLPLPLPLPLTLPLPLARRAASCASHPRLDMPAGYRRFRRLPVRLAGGAGHQLRMLFAPVERGERLPAR